MQPLFDMKSTLLARHAQHVVLIHFPIALFLSGVAFDFLGQLKKRDILQHVAYFNIMLAAIFALPVLASGFLAWRFQLEGQHMRGVLLFHAASACMSSVLIWISWWPHFHSRRHHRSLPRYRFPLEGLGVLTVVLTAHLGGIVSGVNNPL
jgi:uncharacterized membrane protein